MFDLEKFQELVSLGRSSWSSWKGVDVDLNYFGSYGDGQDKLSELSRWFARTATEGCHSLDLLDGRCFVTYYNCGRSGVIIGVFHTRFTVNLPESGECGIAICVLDDMKFHIQTNNGSSDIDLFSIYPNLVPCDTLQDALDLCMVMFPYD